MRAVVLSKQHVNLDVDRSVPTDAGGEILVRVLRAGICETDLQLIAGYMSFEGVLGHEFVGIAEEGTFAGQRVVGEINCACQSCQWCTLGLGNHCPNRSVLGILGRDGAFAEYLRLPERNLHRVPDEVSIDEAVFTEPLAAAFQIIKQVPLDGSQHVVVLGDGRLGNLCAQVIRRTGCHVSVVGKHEEKLKLLNDLDIETQLLRDVQAQRNADVVVDCTGSSTGLETAIQLVKPRGTIVMKTTVAGEQTGSLAPLVIDELTVIGSRCGPFPEAIQALGAREIKVAPLITARYDLDASIEALERAASGGVLKVLLDVGAE